MKFEFLSKLLNFKFVQTISVTAIDENKSLVGVGAWFFMTFPNWSLFLDSNYSLGILRVTLRGIIGELKISLLIEFRHQLWSLFGIYCQFLLHTMQWKLEHGFLSIGLFNLIHQRAFRIWSTFVLDMFSCWKLVFYGNSRLYNTINILTDWETLLKNALSKMNPNWKSNDSRLWSSLDILYLFI